MAFTDRLHNRGSISTGYDIDYSLKLEDDNSEGLIKNYSGDGDRRTWTYSTWIKRTELSQDYYCLFFAAYTGIQIMSEDWLRVELYDGTTTRYADTNQLFRDTSAWYHLVVTLDSTDSTASDRVKIWINGSRVTDFRTSTYASMSQNDQFGIGQASDNYQFGYWFAGGANDRRFCGYVAETHYVNGTALEANDFGEYDSDSNIWIPKEYTGSHGSKGFYFKFDDSSNLGKDSSSGGIGDFSLSNITAADQATDTPTNNFCTMNMLDRTNGNIKTQDGGTKVTTDGGSGWCTMMATMGVTKGKWYWEYFKTTTGGANIFFGIAASDDPYVPYSSAAQYYIGNVAEQTSIGFQVNNNSIANGNSSNVFALLSGEVLRVALDMDNGALYFGKSSSTWANSGDPTSGSSKTGASSLWSSFDDKIVLPGISVYQGGDAQANFGGYAPYTISSAASDANGYGTFEYAPPSGYYALCTKNLAEYG